FGRLLHLALVPCDHRPDTRRQRRRVLRVSRVAAVTGASAGIGRATAIAFGELGWTVAVGARRIDQLEETAKLVDGAGGRALVHGLGVTDPPAVDAVCG